MGYFLEETDQIIQEKTYKEIAETNQASKILDKISDNILQKEELKIDNG